MRYEQRSFVNINPLSSQDLCTLLATLASPQRLRGTRGVDKRSACIISRSVFSSDHYNYVLNASRNKQNPCHPSFAFDTRKDVKRVHDSQRQRDYIITVLKRVISGCRAIIDYRLRATGTHRASTR